MHITQQVSQAVIVRTRRIVEMLKIIFGDTANAVYYPPVYFDNQYLDEWMADPFIKQMVKDVDKSEVIGPHLIESPVLGPISPKELSGGVKTLILMKFDESGKIFNASACGDNCAPWICRIAQSKDLTINLHHIMDFSHVNDFKAIILNTGHMVTGYKEYVDEAIEIEEK